jgi:hypothetical protein
MSGFGSGLATSGLALPRFRLPAPAELRSRTSMVDVAACHVVNAGVGEILYSA